METSVCFCGNKTVNSILSAYTQKAKQAGIRMTVEAAVKQDVGIKDIDFTAILGNAMENAVHGDQYRAFDGCDWRCMQQLYRNCGGLYCLCDYRRIAEG